MALEVMNNYVATYLFVTTEATQGKKRRSERITYIVHSNREEARIQEKQLYFIQEDL